MVALRLLPMAADRPAAGASRYLNRMVLFLVAVAALAAVLYRGLIDAFLTNPGLNGLILGLTLVGIASAFRSVVALKPDLMWLAYLEGQSAGEPPDSTPLPRPRLLAPMVRMLGERFGRLTLTPTAVRSLLDGIAARLGEGREISRYLIGLLVFLGLLGTFWGLIRTIHGIGDVIGDLSIDGADLAQLFGSLKEGLAGPLEGMGTAFGSSLFGLGGSLVLGFLELQAGQAQSRFYNELEDWLAGTARLGGVAPAGEGEAAMPAYLQALLAQTADSLDHIQRTLISAEESRRQTSASLNLLADKLGTLVDQMRSEQSLLVRLADGQTELRPVLSRLVDTANQGGFGIDEATREHIRNLDSHLRRLLEELPAGQERLAAEVRSEIRLLARTLAALAETA